MSSVYISSDEFRDNLNQWLSSGRYANLDVIAKSRQMIPLQFRNYTRRLYLPISVDDKFIDSAMFGRATFTQHNIWTKDEMIARSHFREQKNTKDKYNILITKNVELRHQIIDLDEFASFMGVPQLGVLGFNNAALEIANKRKQVIVSKDVLISRSDYIILSQHGEQR